MLMECCSLHQSAMIYTIEHHISTFKTQINHIKCMEEILTLYKIAKFNIVAIHCDQEFKPTLHNFANQHNIILLSAPSQSHIPRAERNIRMIQERVRTLLQP